MKNEYSVIALTGSPKAGISTMFHGLTGKCSHGGGCGRRKDSPCPGAYRYSGSDYLLIDLPGVYSAEEKPSSNEYSEIQSADVIAVVADADRLELGLHLLKQILEREAVRKSCTPVVFCVNFFDQATEQEAASNFHILEDILQIPVVSCCAGNRGNLDDVKAAIHYAANPDNNHLFSYSGLDFSPESLSRACRPVLSIKTGVRRILADYCFTSPVLGKVLLLFMMAGILRLTMAAAGFPSQLLWETLSGLENRLDRLMGYLGAAPWITGSLVHGGFHALSLVTAVMLPPLTVFFFFFTLLEEMNFLPRAVCAMDPVFEKCGSCGGHCLSMAMGLGCNAAGVACAGAIPAPRERMTAILTCSMVPCFGQLPMFAALIPLFFAAGSGSAQGSLSFGLLFAFLLLGGIYMAMGFSLLLSRTAFKNLPSAFVLEIPPWRRPRLLFRTLPSLLNRTMVTVERALWAAVPAGILVWFLANLIYTGPDNGFFSLARPDSALPSLLASFTGLLEPAGRLLGMDGVILAAFILGFPAHELVLPILIMAYLQGNALTAAGGISPGGGLSMYALFTANGWTWMTVLCTLVFALFHWPCLTTCRAIAREARGWKWAAASMCISTLPGILLCMGISFCVHMGAGQIVP